jgi:hypothetical protein
MPQIIALIDLDDSLFQTRRKCPPGLAESELTVMAVDRAGAPLCFATPGQKAWIDWLAATAVLVPVTARSRDALSRVRLDYTQAVAAHGGVLLREGGTVCPAWHAHIAAAASRHAPQLEALADRFAAAARASGHDIGVRIIGEQDLGLYVVGKHRDPACAADLHGVIKQLRGEIPDGWTIHVNDNNVALLPPFLGKEHAAARLLDELRSRYPGLPVLGLGDSLTDAPFLALCDFIAMPAASQLALHAFRDLGKP